MFQGKSVYVHEFFWSNDEYFGEYINFWLIQKRIVVSWYPLIIKKQQNLISVAGKNKVISTADEKLLELVKTHSQNGTQNPKRSFSIIRCNNDTKLSVEYWNLKQETPTQR